MSEARLACRRECSESVIMPLWLRRVAAVVKSKSRFVRDAQVPVRYVAAEAQYPLAAPMTAKGRSPAAIRWRLVATCRARAGQRSEVGFAECEVTMTSGWSQSG